MKIECLICALTALLLTSKAASTRREYNVWYAESGILYGLTQTSSASPVLISISAQGLRENGMVISFQDALPCEKEALKPLTIDSMAVLYKLSCITLPDGSIKTFTITDPETITYTHNRLKSDFTVVLSGDIKIWAGNIRNPRYGSGHFSEQDPLYRTVEITYCFSAV